jgi:hypothetical protein
LARGAEKSQSELKLCAGFPDKQFVELFHGAAEKMILVILSAAKNFSVHSTLGEERFLASLRMTPKIGVFRML